MAHEQILGVLDESALYAYQGAAQSEGSATAAEGNHGSAETQIGFLWNRLGRRQEMHLLRLFPSGKKGGG